MKVNIGPYRGDIVPINRLERWYEYKRSGKLYLDEEEYTWYDKAFFATMDFLRTIFRPLNRWSNNRERKIKVKVDYYDVWSADHTLAHIIYPVLLELQKVKHGSPDVANSDVPKHLRVAEHNVMNPDTKVWETDDLYHKRWEWVLNEMVWAFEQCTKHDRGEDQFHHNLDQLDMTFKPCEDKPGYSEAVFNYQKDPNKPKYWVDKKGKAAHNKRIQNGLRLFAKYYFALWD